MRSFEVDTPDIIFTDTNNVEEIYFLSEIDYAILSTIAYRDQFDFAVSKEEVHKFLHGVQASSLEVEAALMSQIRNGGYLETDGSHYALKGRSGLFELRHKRSIEAQALWLKAKTLGSILASMPFVRMVAVTGSLAVDNPYYPIDVDFMIITDAGKVWRIRALSKVLQMIDRKWVYGALCANYQLSLSSLILSDRRLYIAQELAQMVPLYGADVYQEFIAANDWAQTYLPNAFSNPDMDKCERQVRFPISKQILEFISGWPFGDILERWESKRKIHKYNETDFLGGNYSKFTKEAAGHNIVRGNIIEDNWREKMRNLGLKVPD